MSALAPSTLRAYTQRLEHIGCRWESWFNTEENEGSDYVEFDPKTQYDSVIQFIKTLGKKPETNKGYITALLHATKDCPDAYKAYYAYFQTLKQTCIDNAKKQELPPSRQQKYLTKDQLNEIYNECYGKWLADQTDYYDHLVLALYIIQPPVRADYANMPILSYETYHKVLHEMNEKGVGGTFTTNFCVIDNQNTYDPNRNFFHFINYKTAKTYGRQMIPIYQPLWELLKHHHFKRNEAKVLPDYYTASYLAKKVPEIIAKYSGKKCSIGLIRHAWVFELYSGNPTILEKEKLARYMLHSVAVQELYRTTEAVEEMLEEN